ncbi:hypothetical protein Pan189_10230 [Stratiformator vulcanicus]|uniref:Uncharacterized protein n=1 Tax=Stratiformator vulcanicus TaxID=2527980 RepID=A0A517QYE6_9PLAN|nr:hypothetical protein Pan189_10230 [Stratiformator vulcanicus]
MSSPRARYSLYFVNKQGFYASIDDISTAAEAAICDFRRDLLTRRGPANVESPEAVLYFISSHRGYDNPAAKIQKRVKIIDNRVSCKVSLGDTGEVLPDLTCPSDSGNSRGEVQ